MFDRAPVTPLGTHTPLNNNYIAVRNTIVRLCEKLSGYVIFLKRSYTFMENPYHFSFIVGKIYLISDINKWISHCYNIYCET